jgi:hypothetical protein
MLKPETTTARKLSIFSENEFTGPEACKWKSSVGRYSVFLLRYDCYVTNTKVPIKHRPRQTRVRRIMARMRRFPADVSHVIVAEYATRLQCRLPHMWDISSANCTEQRIIIEGC